jgi:hypothetical protein
MRKITYFCDCCKKEIADIEHNVGAPNQIFGQYGEKAAYDVHACSSCIVKINEAVDAVVLQCSAVTLD